MSEQVENIKKKTRQKRNILIFLGTSGNIYIYIYIYSLRNLKNYQLFILINRTENPFFEGNFAKSVLQNLRICSKFDMVLYSLISIYQPHV